jgi:hypothetical protein
VVPAEDDEEEGGKTMPLSVQLAADNERRSVVLTAVRRALTNYRACFVGVFVVAPALPASSSTFLKDALRDAEPPFIRLKCACVR